MLVGLVAALISVAAWGLLVAERRGELLAGTRVSASEIESTVELGLEETLSTLYGLTDLWEDFGLGPADEWQANVGLRVDDIPGIDFVAWVDRAGSERRVAVGSGRRAEDVELDLDEAPRHLERPHLEGPARDPAGEVTYRVFLPVEAARGRSGVLVAGFHVRPFLEARLRARGTGHALSVFWGDEEIYSRGIGSADPNQAWWRVETPVDLPLGGTWRVVLRPTAEFAAARLTPIPHYLLVLGLLLSLALGVVAHQLRLGRRQSRFLAASNLALERRGVELESSVADRTEALEEAVAELEAFNYSVSHDLRSPLGAIQNFVAILREDYEDRALDEGALRILDRIQRSASRATSLLEDLLQLSRAGRVSLDLERIDMVGLTRETFAQVRAAVDPPAVDEFFVGTLPDVWADRHLLGAVLANLLSNALKYSRGKEKIRIRVTGRIEGGECLYEVADEGQGFDMRFADKLFGLFERLHSAEDIEGTGVGLAMVARIVKRHGGRVWAEGRPGEGAVFGFALPVREGP